MKLLFLSKNTLLQVLYFVIMSLMIGIVALINFVEWQFEFSRLLDPSFWVPYVVTIVVGLFGFFLSVWNGNMKRRNSPEIIEITKGLAYYFSFITSNDGLYKKFKDYLEYENNEKKKKLYITSLKRRREKVKTEAEIEKLDRLIENASQDYEYKDIKFNRKTVNLIFAGFRTTDDDEYLTYTGRENMALYLGPSIAIGLLITTIVLSFGMFFRDPTLDTFIQLATRLLSIFVYIYKAGDYSDYSINVVYKSVLNNRIGVVQCFMDKIGYKIKISDNPISKTKEEDKK